MPYEMIETLFSSPLMVATLECNRRLVRLRRTSERLDLKGFASLEEYYSLHLPRPLRRGRALLLDSREALMVSDPELQQRMTESARRLFDGFDRTAVLVRTAVGKLQINRMARQGAPQLAVFDDEAAAIAWLLA